MKWLPPFNQCTLRSVIAAVWVFMIVRVTIPDYGYDYTLFENLAYDPVGWLHECFYISTFFLMLFTVSVLYETWQRWLERP